MKTLLENVHPCPFCGAMPTIEQTSRNGLELKCSNCLMGYRQKTLHHSLDWLKERMIERWNTRLQFQQAETPDFKEIEKQLLDRFGFTSDGVDAENQLKIFSFMDWLKSQQAETPEAHLAWCDTCKGVVNHMGDKCLHCGTTKPKTFTVAKIRALEKQVIDGEISYSRMVEIMNEMARETPEPVRDGIDKDWIFEIINKTTDFQKQLIENHFNRHKVFSRPECVYQYCPHPEICKDKCAFS